MPFPSKEIEDAYDVSRPIAQGYFKDEKEVLENGWMMQQRFDELRQRCDDETMGIVKALLQLSQESQEYQCRHGFTEGWLAAKGQNE